MIPFEFGLGYRLIPNLMVGAYFSAGAGLLGSFFDGCTNCSAKDLRLGAQVHYHVMPFRMLDPWVGAGFGYEWLAFSIGQDSVTASGLEMFNLQAGFDVAVKKAREGRGTWFGLGPVVSFSMGRFTGAACSGPGTRCDGISDPALHEWLTLGIRGVLLP